MLRLAGDRMLHTCVIFTALLAICYAGLVQLQPVNIVDPLPRVDPDIKLTRIVRAEAMANKFAQNVMQNKALSKTSADRISMRVARGAPSPASGVCPACSYADRDFLIIMDSSGGIRPEDYEIAKMDLAIVATILCGNLGVDLRVAAMQFSQDPEMQFPFDEYIRQFELFDLFVDIATMKRMRSNTMTWKAFNFAKEVMFIPAKGNRPGAHKQALIVTDGYSNGATNATALSIAAAQALKDSGVELFGLWIGNRPNTDEIRAYVSDPVDKHAFDVDSVQSLADFAREIQLIYEKISC